MEYFERLLPTIYRHNRYTATNRREHTVALYRGLTAFHGKILHRITMEAILHSPLLPSSCDIAFGFNKGKDRQSVPYLDYRYASLDDRDKL
jgi:hypothetical protein